MDEPMVRVERFPSEWAVVGPAVIVAPLDQIAEKLAESGFMKSWFVEKIREHLLAGGTFVNRGAAKSDYEQSMVPGQVYVRARSEYRLATKDEVLNYVDVSEYASRTGKSITARAQTTAYSLRYHEDLELIKKYDKLPRQAKVVLDLLSEGGRETYTEASIGVVLHDGVERLKTTQDPMTVFKFYKPRFLDEGHLVGAEPPARED